MPVDYAASVQGVAIRVTKLDTDGSLIGTQSYTSKSFIRVSFTPEYEEGDEITEKNADGTICVTFKAPDTLKRVTMEVAVCDPDPVLSTLLSGGVLLVGPVGTGASPPVEPLGWASAQTGEDVSGDGVAVEVWSRAILHGKPALPNPYFHWIFPYVKTRLSGDRVIENGLLANTYEGYGLGNDAFDVGPDTGKGDTAWPWPEVTGRPYMYGRVPNMPDVARGLTTWSAPGGPAPVPMADIVEDTDPDSLDDNVSSSAP